MIKNEKIISLQAANKTMELVSNCYIYSVNDQLRLFTNHKTVWIFSLRWIV